MDAVRLDIPNPGVVAQNFFLESAMMLDILSAAGMNGLRPYFFRTSKTFGQRDAYLAIVASASEFVGSRYAVGPNQERISKLVAASKSKFGVSCANQTPDSAELASQVAAYYRTNWPLGSVVPVETNTPPFDIALPAEGQLLPDLIDSWRPLRMSRSVTQNGLIDSNVQRYVGRDWGTARPFAVDPQSIAVPSPEIVGASISDRFRLGLEIVLRANGVMVKTCGCGLGK
jgi:hypothetical protein